MKPLTIGHIDTELTWRGGEKQALELIRGLAERGQTNVLFCRPDSAIGEKARACGIETVALPLRGEWDILSARQIAAEVTARHIDIIHTHTAHAHTIGLIALAGKPSCRLVVSRRVDFHIRNAFGRKLKYGRRVNRIIAVSEAIRRVLIDDGIDPERIVTIKSGFVPGQFDQDGSRDLRTEMGIDADTVVIATVAALAPHKSHTDLLKAASLVVREHANVRFLLAGDGEMRETIEQQIVNLGLTGSVTLLGFVEDVGVVYRAADLFALTSEEEGLCTSLLDAMYFGLPVVATSAGGIPELVQDRKNGFIVPVHDYMSLADRLNILISSPEKRREMGGYSADILARHTVAHTIDQTLALYRELTGEEHTGEPDE